MTTCIALLRGVNVGGRRMVSMTALKTLLTDLGLGEARSILQSGNLCFRSRTADSHRLERLLEAETARQLALETRFFVRTAAEWSDVLERNPFAREARTQPGRLIVMFLKTSPSSSAVSVLRAAIVGAERVRVVGRQAYVVYPEGVGRSKLTHAVLERTLQTAATGRNWNTVLKLGAVAGQ